MTLVLYKTFEEQLQEILKGHETVVPIIMSFLDDAVDREIEARKAKQQREAEKRAKDDSMARFKRRTNEEVTLRFRAAGKDHLYQTIQSKVDLPPNVRDIADKITPPRPYDDHVTYWTEDNYLEQILLPELSKVAAKILNKCSFADPLHGKYITKYPKQFTIQEFIRGLGECIRMANKYYEISREKLIVFRDWTLDSFKPILLEYICVYFTSLTDAFDEAEGAFGNGADPEETKREFIEKVGAVLERAFTEFKELPDKLEEERTAGEKRKRDRGDVQEKPKRVETEDDDDGQEDDEVEEDDKVEE